MESAVIQDIAGSMQKIEDDAAALAGQGGEVAADRIFHLSNDDLIAAVDAAVTAHGKWMADLRSIVETMQVKPLQLDDRRCGFGHFYHSVKPTAPEAEEIWLKVGVHHHALHQKGGTVIQRVKTGDRTGAAASLHEADSLSKSIIAALQELKSLSQEMKERNQSVL